MKKVGLKEIAEHVGVSVALVSYVLNGQAVEKQVNKETAERITAAAAEMNYQPNQIARSLKIKKTHTIGLVVADINYRFTTGITRAIEEEAKRNNYTVIYGSSNESQEKLAELINVFINRRVDGLIIVPVENSEEEIRALQQSEVPFVLVDRNFPDIETNYIALDNYNAAYNATSYLISTGHKRISFINYKSTLYHLQERNRGYMAALKDAGIRFNEYWLQEVSSNNRFEDVQKSINNIVNVNEPCDAVFFATDTLAITGLKCLSINKLQVPADISALSFDESDAFELYYTPVTHSRQPLVEMGKLAVNTLIELINHNKVNKHINLQAELIIGGSCRTR